MPVAKDAMPSGISKENKVCRAVMVFNSRLLSRISLGSVSSFSISACFSYLLFVVFLNPLVETVTLLLQNHCCLKQSFTKRL